MTRLIHKGIRFELGLVKRIERIARQTGSTFSQVVRQATIREVEMVERMNGRTIQKGG